MKTLQRPMAALFFFLALAGSAMADETYALPDPAMTPGAVDPKAPPIIFCNRTTKERRLRISTHLIEAIARTYNVPVIDMGVRYQLDHLVPLSIGGANVVENLWPQPVVEAARTSATETSKHWFATTKFRFRRRSTAWRRLGHLLSVKKACCRRALHRRCKPKEGN